MSRSFPRCGAGVSSSTASASRSVPILGDNGADVAKQLDGAVVGPVVDDVLHEVEISSRGNRLEEVAGDCFASVRQAILGDGSLAAGIQRGHLRHRSTEPGCAA